VNPRGGGCVTETRGGKKKRFIKDYFETKIFGKRAAQESSRKETHLIEAGSPKKGGTGSGGDCWKKKRSGSCPKLKEEPTGPSKKGERGGGKERRCRFGGAAWKERKAITFF